MINENEINATYMQAASALQAVAQNGGRVLVLGGAGMSCDSGLPDFRGTNGMYRNSSIKLILNRKFISTQWELYK